MFYANPLVTQYKNFWLDPNAAPLPWVSLLFSILSIGVFLSLRAGDTLTGLPSDPMSTMANYHQRSTECLLLSYYWKPKPYTIESLLMNLQSEFIRSQDSELGVWALAGTVTRLAMSMGYHRDPAQYPQISCFHGEMRRRVWAGIVQLDIFFSFQLGLPRMIAMDQCDTLPPRNLLDSDFSIDTKELPQSRPDTDYTPAAYTRAKGRLLAVFADIADKSSSVQPREYRQYLEFDQRLNEAYAAIPEHLQIKHAEEYVAASAAILVRRHLLELLYQKSRCILHREYMIKAAHDSTVMYSRSACVDAAMTLLGEQMTIHQQIQKGCVLSRERWFLNSLHHTDFILAAMIVCLELNFRLEGGPRQPRLVDELGRAKYENQTLIQALHSSYDIWNEWKVLSKVPTQAARILSIMLRKADSEHLPKPTQTFAGVDLERQKGPQLGKSTALAL
ncbi:uncharacterized protein A1O9_00475 [Exophiala aquamarina CBS 119918]|uniref:Xylanolytic transcriptional activator regulatory domain-containing protein n=1 Tax=Exophiala aquamarina CBS 119918 TaxID=1182545 RepID=A0A072PRV6_9EURO|nr:uncharacterized protein A1O9_00475 [Exophiala aquamarina CBS 119918]KEF62502.1 hypothetical protein A1O9_00475 [Exophiala aquamarina CBS 119918]